jgi:hypothetical protein
VARRKVHNVAAIVKAYEAEAKRAERAAKGLGRDPLGQWWADYAVKCRRQALEASKQPAEVTAEPDLLPVAEAVAPASGNAWRDHLMNLEAIDAARFAANRAEVVTL